MLFLTHFVNVACLLLKYCKLCRSCHSGWLMLMRCKCF